MESKHFYSNGPETQKVTSTVRDKSEDKLQNPFRHCSRDSFKQRIQSAVWDGETLSPVYAPFANQCMYVWTGLRARAAQSGEPKFVGFLGKHKGNWVR